jgi:uncharacterized protein (DUF1330 family)
VAERRQRGGLQARSGLACGRGDPAPGLPAAAQSHDSGGRRADTGLDADSAYEIQFLWLSRDNASAYEEYEKAMTAALGEFGGRVIANLAVDSYETLQPWPHQPDKIVILEWPDTAARTGYLSGDGYQRTQPLLHSGVANADSFLTRATSVE